MTYSACIRELEFRARIKKVQTVPQNQGEALVPGVGSKQPLQQQSTPACFIGPV